MLKSCLCDYSDAYILAKGTITVAGAGETDSQRARQKLQTRDLKKLCIVTDCMKEINETHQYIMPKILML